MLYNLLSCTFIEIIKCADDPFVNQKMPMIIETNKSIENPNNNPVITAKSNEINLKTKAINDKNIFDRGESTYTTLYVGPDKKKTVVKLKTITIIDMNDLNKIQKSDTVKTSESQNNKKYDSKQTNNDTDNKNEKSDIQSKNEKDNLKIEFEEKKKTLEEQKNKINDELEKKLKELKDKKDQIKKDDPNGNKHEYEIKKEEENLKNDARDKITKIEIEIKNEEMKMKMKLANNENEKNKVIEEQRKSQEKQLENEIKDKTEDKVKKIKQKVGMEKAKLEDQIAQLKNESKNKSSSKDKKQIEKAIELKKNKLNEIVALSKIDIDLSREDNKDKKAELKKKYNDTKDKFKMKKEEIKKKYNDDKNSTNSDDNKNVQSPKSDEPSANKSENKSKVLITKDFPYIKIQMPSSNDTKKDIDKNSANDKPANENKVGDIINVMKQLPENQANPPIYIEGTINFPEIGNEKSKKYKLKGYMTPK